ncbi:type 2 lantipeptide synthetase LanM [Sinorhizobium medicae]|nr:type 2 lantipeptide synthetase LanM [Sinorhizobium medicae]
MIDANIRKEARDNTAIVALWPLVDELADPVGNTGAPREKAGSEDAFLSGLCFAARQDISRTPCLAKELPFVHLWFPLAEVAMGLLPQAALAPTVIGQLIVALTERLCALGADALQQILQERRGAGASVIAALAPEKDPSAAKCEIYDRLTDELRQTHLAELLDRFPVLRRLIPFTIAVWIRNLRELLARLEADRTAIAQNFRLPEDAALSGMQFAVGDTHKGGRSVVLLEFTWQGRQTKLVYKPRNLALEAAFQNLLADPRASIGLSPLPGLKIWCAEDYGYMEFVEGAPCDNEDVLQAFYRSAGRLAALLHVLGYTDGHHENLVAHHSHLYVIDAETLLTPFDKPAIRRPRPGDSLGAAQTAWSWFDTTVARTELFPAWTLLGLARDAVDTSAFGIDPQEWPRQIPGWHSINTDNMARTVMIGELVRTQSLPVTSDRKNPFFRHRKLFMAGFHAQCRSIIANKPVWLGEDGLLQAFNGCKGRAVIRATRIYAALARRQLTAEALRSEQSQADVLYPLERLFAPLADRQDVSSLCASEKLQMRQLDIPVFTHTVSQTALNLTGDQRIDDYFETSGLAASRERIEALSCERIEREIETIDALASAKALRLAQHGRSCENSLQPITNPTDQLLSEIRRRSDGWIGFDLAPDGIRFCYQPLGMSLVSGTLGLAVYLAATGRPEACHIAENLAEPLLRLAESGTSAERLRWWRDLPIGLRGSGGQLLALSALQRLSIMADRIPHAMQQLVAVLDRALLEDKPWDVWSGYAGLLGPLLLVNSDTADTQAEMVACRLADWTSREAETAPSGFAQGAFGVLAALSQFAHASGNANIRASVQSLLQHSSEAFWRFGPRAGSEWSCGIAGHIITCLCLRHDQEWRANADAAIRRGVIGLASLPNQGAGIHSGTAGVEMACASSAQATGNLPCSSDTQKYCDPRHLGLFTGVAGIGFAQIRDERSNAARDLIISAGLLPTIGH